MNHFNSLAVILPAVTYIFNAKTCSYFRDNACLILTQQPTPGSPTSQTNVVVFPGIGGKLHLSSDCSHS